MNLGIRFVVLGMGLLFFNADAFAQESEAKNAVTVATSTPTPKLIRALKNNAYKVRVQAAVLLGRSNDDAAVKPLCDALVGDPNKTVRLAAAQSLSQLAKPAATDALIKSSAVDKEAEVRAAAQQALEGLPRSAAVPVAEKSFEAGDERIRRQSLAFLLAGPPAVSDTVLARALGDSPEIYATAQKTLATRGKDALWPFLDAAIESKESKIRQGAVRLLRSLAQPEAAVRLIKVYERDLEEEKVRSEARAALYELRSFLPVEQLRKDAAFAPDKNVRARALHLLGVVGGADAKTALLNALLDTDLFVRGAAVIALGEMGEADVVPTLEKMTAEPGNQKIAHLLRHSIKQLSQKP